MNKLLKAVKNYVEVCEIGYPLHGHPNITMAHLDHSTPAQREMREANLAVEKAERSLDKKRATIELLEAISMAENE